MAELAWPDDLGHGTFIGRFGFMDADTHDTARDPDITSATGGTVTITPSIKSVRYSGAQGPMILAARPAKGVIDAEGYLCTKQEDGTPGDRGMVFPATDDTDLSPTDWTYEVSIVLDGSVRLPTFNVNLPEGATVDLSLAVPVDTSGGTAVVVDPTTAERAEAAADRAETAADEAEGYAPTFVWDGTQLVIDGEQGPDLKGEKGDGSSWAELTGKPTSFPTTVGDVDGITVDTTVGTRVFVGDVMIHGETEKRDMTALFTSGLSPDNTGRILISRRGSRVVIEFTDALLAPGVGSLAWSGVLNSGWRPHQGSTFLSVARWNSVNRLQAFTARGSSVFWTAEVTVGANVASTNTRPAEVVRGQIEYDAGGWPSSLPGIPDTITDLSRAYTESGGDAADLVDALGPEQAAALGT